MGDRAVVCSHAVSLPCTLSCPSGHASFASVYCRATSPPLLPAADPSDEEEELPEADLAELMDRRATRVAGMTAAESAAETERRASYKATMKTIWQVGGSGHW